MVIYGIVCSESLKLYIGQHKNDDLTRYFQQKWYDAHRYSGKRSHLYAALRKHPRETWSIWPLVSGIEVKAELDALEKHFIRVLKTQHPDVGYNLCDGGEGRTGPHSEATKHKLSVALTGKHRTPEQVQVQVKRAKREYIESPEYQKRLSRKGFKFSDESRKKMSDSHLGQSRPQTEEHKRRISEALFRFNARKRKEVKDQ
jgi:NUMOD3 motif